MMSIKEIEIIYPVNLILPYELDQRCPYYFYFWSEKVWQAWKLLKLRVSQNSDVRLRPEAWITKGV